VVIAILAILAGVGVPAYSGYVKKANMQADMTLISEIEHALTLAGYSSTFPDGEGGYLILSADGAVQGVGEGSPLENALIAAFGANYADTLKLKYAEWGNNGVLGDVDIMGAVSASSYKNGIRKNMLIDDVEKMTKMASNFTSVLGESGGMTFSELFGANNLYNTAKQYGIGDEDWTVADWDKWGKENSDAYSNLLVLAAADEAENNLNNPDDEMSIASTLILNFSSYYGYAATNPDFSAVLDQHMADLSGVTDDVSGKAWFDSLEKAASESEGYETYKSTQGNLDKLAFQGILAALGNPTTEQARNIANDLDNANLFSAGVVNGMYNDYMNAVDAVVAMDNSGNDVSNFGKLSVGEIMVWYVLGDGILRISDSMPSA